MEVLVKNAFDRQRVAISFVGKKSKTQQQFAKEADINTILKKYEKTGLLVDPSIINKDMFYGDFSQCDSYEEALNKITVINEQFMRLNPGVRAQFNNDPGIMLEFLSEPKNWPEAVKMGILDRDVLKKEELEPNGESNVLKDVKNVVETKPTV